MRLGTGALAFTRAGDLVPTGELIAYARQYELTTLPMLVIKRGRLRVERPQGEALTQELTAPS